MSYEVIVSPRATLELETLVAELTSGYGSAAASKYTRGFDEIRERLKLQPMSYGAVRLVGQPPAGAAVRRARLEKFLLLFSVDEPSRRVVVEAVVYGRRDLRLVLGNLRR